MAANASALGRRAAWALPVLTLVPALLLGSVTLRTIYTDFPGPSIYQQARASMNEGTRMLAVGSSLVRSGLRPSLFSVPTVNLAPNWSGYDLMELLFMRALERCPRTRWLLIELDNHGLLTDRRAHSTDFRQLYELGVRRRDVVPGRIEALRLFLRDNVVCFPFFYLRRLTPVELAWRRDAPAIQREPGFWAHELRMTTDLLAERDFAADEQYLGAACEKINRTALQEMITRARARHIQPVFIRMPQLEAYYKARSADWWRKEDELVRLVKETLGEQAVILDCRRMVELKEYHFGDTRHLNVEGATLFTREIDMILKSRFEEYGR